MKKNVLTILIYYFAFFFFAPVAFSQSNPVEFSQEDRERIIRLDERLLALDERLSAQKKEINTRFEAMNDKFEAINDKFEAMNDKFETMFDRLHTLMYFILAGLFGLIGLIFWDRRSYIKPVKEDINEILSVLKKYAQKQPELAEILRSYGLM
ncbi:MAG: hypothetical protein FVQ77_10715 [Cytophagales bacterium]|nr:hypothetical protein [Cytophagales bacterium]